MIDDGSHPPESSPLTAQWHRRHLVVGMKHCTQKAHESWRPFLSKLATISLLLDTTVCIHGLRSTGWEAAESNVLKVINAFLFKWSE